MHAYIAHCVCVRDGGVGVPGRVSYVHNVCGGVASIMYAAERRGTQVNALPEA